ncbi:MAG: RHS repeat-associated core domain-containing protein [Ruminococcaceae bacterium]|nr:RHS repeat-associated core domain-containing protein [Oscillospiraceae bacterium]
MVYNGTTYTYRKNLQGDIIAILNSAGTEVVTYTYNAWGVATVGGTMASTLGTKNPFRYRGYYYDTETGYYYLNSRYYDPVTGRFLNADGYVSTGQGLLGYNMFAYCGNNPVNRVDRNGEFFSFIENLINNIGNSIQSMFGVYAGCGGAAIADGPLPFGDIAAGIVAVGTTIFAVGVGVYNTVTYSDSIPQDDVDEKVKDKYRPPKLPTTIYRYNGGTPDNLTPSQRDVDFYPKTGKGLSFSLIPKPGCVETTIEEVNELGGATLSQYWKSPLPQGAYNSYWDLIPLFFK